MSTSTSNTELSVILNMVHNCINEENFLNLNKNYQGVLDPKLLSKWEESLSKLGLNYPNNDDVTILVPLSLMKVINFDNKKCANIFFLLKFIGRLVFRFFNKYGDIKSIMSLIYLTADNFDTWLLRNINLRPYPYIDPTDERATDKYIKDNFLNFDYENNPDIKLVYENFDTFVNTVAIIYNRLSNNIELIDDEKDMIAHLMVDFINTLFSKARHHKDSIGVCNYCNTIYHYSYVQKINNNFLSISAIDELCSECFIELKHKEPKIRNFYANVKGKNKNVILKYFIVYDKTDAKSNVVVDRHS